VESKGSCPSASATLCFHRPGVPWCNLIWSRFSLGGEVRDLFIFQRTIRTLPVVYRFLMQSVCRECVVLRLVQLPDVHDQGRLTTTHSKIALLLGFSGGRCARCVQNSVLSAGRRDGAGNVSSRVAVSRQRQGRGAIAPMPLPRGFERLTRKYVCGVVPSIVRNISMKALTLS